MLGMFSVLALTLAALSLAPSFAHALEALPRLAGRRRPDGLSVRPQSLGDRAHCRGRAEGMRLHCLGFLRGSLDEAHLKTRPSFSHDDGLHTSAQIGKALKGPEANAPPPLRQPKTKPVIRQPNRRAPCLTAASPEQLLKRRGAARLHKGGVRETRLAERKMQRR